MKYFVFGMALCFSIPAFATLSIPTSLSDGEQLLVLQTLGLGTAFKPVDNPYPLGGYAGLEVGLGFHSVATGNIGYYGSQAVVNNYTIYPSISLGKGIFDNVDLLFDFLPFNLPTNIGVFSGGMRWSFYQPAFVPATVSLLLSGASSNFNNLFFCQTAGADVITSMNFDPFAFYFGAGAMFGQAQFSGTLTIEGQPTAPTANAFHTVIGTSVTLYDAFLAAEVDTYNNTVVSLKIGTRL